jgi:hypothetical protein
VSTQVTLDEKKSCVACIELPLAMNKFLRFLNGSGLIMLKRSLAHMDYKTRHYSILSSFLFFPTPQVPITMHVKSPLKN